MQTDLKRDLDLGTLVLESGAHDPEKGFCFMEAVAYVAGEDWSDSPKCACPVLSSFMRSCNDSLDDNARQRLKPYVLRLIGTNDGNGLRRSWLAFDWLTRTCGPAFMDLTVGLGDSAAALRGLREIDSRESLEVAKPVIAAAAKAAAAAADAAGAAAGDAAWDAARAAAWDAAWDAAWAAAGAAAWAAAGAAAGDAAWDAARAAAWDAAWRKLAPIVARLQNSALELIERMLSIGTANASPKARKRHAGGKQKP